MDPDGSLSDRDVRPGITLTVFRALSWVEPDSTDPATIHLDSFFPFVVDIFSDSTHAGGFDINDIDASTIQVCNTATPLHDLTDPSQFADHTFDIDGGGVDLRIHIQHNTCTLPVTAAGDTTPACFTAFLEEDEGGVQQQVAGCEEVIVEDNFIFE